MFQHIYREINKRADQLANEAADGKLIPKSVRANYLPLAVKAYFDGAYRSSTNVGSCGWVLYGSWTRDSEGYPKWLELKFEPPNPFDHFVRKEREHSYPNLGPFLNHSNNNLQNKSQNGMHISS